MNNNSITASYESLPWLVKMIIQIFLGGVVGGIYRILRFLETRNTTTLIVGILALVTGIGNVIFWVLDLISQYKNNRITLFVD